LFRTKRSRNGKQNKQRKRSEMVTKHRSGRAMYNINVYIYIYMNVERKGPRTRDEVLWTESQATYHLYLSLSLSLSLTLTLSISLVLSLSLYIQLFIYGRVPNMFALATAWRAFHRSTTCLHTWRNEHRRSKQHTKQSRVHLIKACVLQ